MKNVKQKIYGRQLLPAHKVFMQTEPIYISLFSADKVVKKQRVWTLSLENGQRDSGKVKRNAINLPAGLPVGVHLLTVIEGKPLLTQGYKIFECQLTIISQENNEASYSNS